MDFTFEILLRTVVWSVLSGLFIYFLYNVYYYGVMLWKVFKFDAPKSSILGHLDILSLPTDIIMKKLGEFAQEYYPHYYLRLAHRSAVILSSPEDCEIFLGSRKHSSKSEMYRLLETWLRDGLLLSKGDKWLERRKILTPAFHFSILKDFLLIFNEQTETVLDKITAQCKDSINVTQLANDYTLNSITETAMGQQLQASKKDINAYKESILELESILEFMLFRPWYHYAIIYLWHPLYHRHLRLVNILHNFTTNIINQRMKTFKGITRFENLKNQKGDEDDIYMGKRKHKLAMLDVLLQAKMDGEQIDYTGICEEVDTFMFEGHDTTSAAIGFSLMLIANHPDIQEQLYEEIQSVLGDRTKITNDDLKKMDLLERCIKETLRLYPSVFFISRSIDEDTRTHTGPIIPKDCIIVVLIFALHKNPDIYPEPEKFDPDRFLPDNCQKRHPYAYLPFSAGPRNCIGQRFAMMELKVLLARIIQRFKLTPVDTPETIELKPEIILRTKKNIRVKFDARH